MTTRILFITGPEDALNRQLQDALSGRAELLSVSHGSANDEIADAASRSEIVVIGPGAESAHELIPGDGSTRAVQFTGCDQPYVAVSALQSAGIQVANANIVLAPFVADQTMELIERGIGLAWDEPRATLSDLTVGIVGLGNAGIEFARRLRGRVARLVYHDIRTVQQGFASEVGARRQTLDRVLLDSDVVTLHVSDTPHSAKMIGEREFRLMKPGSILANTSLSGAIDERALLDALAVEKPAVAALGTIEAYPNGSPNPLAGASRAVVNRWRATESDEALRAVADLVAENIIRFESQEELLGLMEPVGFPGVGDPAFWSSHLAPRQVD